MLIVLNFKYLPHTNYHTPEIKPLTTQIWKSDYKKEQDIPPA